MLIRIKHCIASIIDFFLISFAVIIPFYLIDPKPYNINITFLTINPIANSTNISLLMWIIFFTLLVFKDALFQYSIGKKIMKLSIYKDNTELKSPFILVLRNIISLIFLTIYPLTIILLNQSIGDLIFHTTVKNNH